MVTIDILTPVFQSGEVLETCIRSVNDQGSHVSHYIQDGNSKDRSTREVLSRYSDRVVSEPDQGMYDALNRAFSRGSGDVIGHLNADEQYLPDVLGRVAEIFASSPHLDVLCGDMIVVDKRWKPICYRVTVRPPEGSAAHIALSVPTCAMFIRRSVYDGKQLHYRTDLKAISDCFFVEALVKANLNWRLERAPFAAFSVHGANLSQSGVEIADRQRAQISFSRAKSLRFRIQIWIARLLAGAYRSRNIDTRLYTSQHLTERARIHCPHLGWRHPTIGNETPFANPRG